MAEKSSLSLLMKTSSMILLNIICQFTADAATDCSNGSIIELSAWTFNNTLTSPKYPDKYPANCRSRWLLQSMPGYVVKIMVEELSMTCLGDRLEIFDGESPQSERLANLCGSSTSTQIFYSSDRKALISFNSDVSVRTGLRGFRVTYTALRQASILDEPETKCACSDGLSLLRVAASQRTNLQTPNFPLFYPRRCNCSWLLLSPGPGYIIYFELQYKIEEAGGCLFDHLEIFDGGSKYSPELARLCGNLTAPVFEGYSSGHELFISFTSDDVVEDSGFDIWYSAIKPLNSTEMNSSDVRHSVFLRPEILMATPVNSRILTSPNYPSQYPQYSHCNWLLRSDPSYVVKIVVRNLTLYWAIGCTYNRLELFDGVSRYFPLLARLCGSVTSEEFHSTGHAVLVSFYSESLEQRGGFSLTYEAVTSPSPSVPRRQQFSQNNTECRTALPALYSDRSYSKYITSPNNMYYNQPSKNDSCAWILMSASGYVLKMVVEEINTEDTSCVNESLQIFDGGSKIYPRLARLCGSGQRLQTFYTTGSQAFVTFNSSGRFDGFLLTFRAVVITPPTCCLGVSSTANPDDRCPRPTEIWTERNTSKVITSPNYPGAYPINVQCTWQLKSPGYPFVLKIVVEDINIDEQTYCINNRLEIFDGGSLGSRRLALLCGNRRHETFYSSGSLAFVSFTAYGLPDSYYTKGFKLSYMAVSRSEIPTISGWTTRSQWTTLPFSNTSSGPVSGCSSRPLNVLVERNSSRYITSPNYPGKYPGNVQCVWLLKSSPYDVLKMVVEELNTETTSSCNYDRLEIFDGGSKWAKRLAILCGNQSRQPFYSSGSTALVSFTSDISVEYPIGFKLTYTAVSSSEVPTTSRWTTYSPFTTSSRWTNLPSSTTSCNPWTSELSAYRYSSGFITSPSITYPNYTRPKFAQCAWRLRSRSYYYNYVLKIEVEYLNIDSCMFDRLEIFDGDSIFAKRLALLCGNQSRLTFYSSGSTAFISFTSDGSTEYPNGFKLAYTAVSRSEVPTTWHWTTMFRWTTSSPITSLPFVTGSFRPVSECYPWTEEVPVGYLGRYLTSPNYPFTYPKNVQCAFLLRSARSDSVLKLVVEDLNLETHDSCNFDRLEIFDGATNMTTQLARLCGNQSRQTFYSSGNSTLVTFRSDGSTEFNKGFKIACTMVVRSDLPTTPRWTSSSRLTTSSLWTASSKWITSFRWTSLPSSTTSYAPVPSSKSACGAGGNGSLNAAYLTKKYIESPDYPDYYPHNALCAWTIRAQRDYRVHLKVLDMNMELSHGCGNDAITLYDAESESSSDLLARLCSKDIVEDYYSTGNVMYITFASNSANSFHGFRLMYEAVPPPEAHQSEQGGSNSHGHLQMASFIIVVLVVVVFLLVVVVVLFRRRQRRRRARQARAEGQFSVTYSPFDRVMPAAVVSPSLDPPPSYSLPSAAGPDLFIAAARSPFQHAAFQHSAQALETKEQLRVVLGDPRQP